MTHLLCLDFGLYGLEDDSVHIILQSAIVIFLDPYSHSWIFQGYRMSTHCGFVQMNTSIQRFKCTRVQ